MKKILKEMLDSKKEMPLLFYPEINTNIKDVLENANLQAEVLKSIDEKYDTCAVVRLSELWCEAKSFGVEVKFSDNDFPKVLEPLFMEADEMEDIKFPPVLNETTIPMINSVKLAVPKMSKPLLVGVTGPYTLGCVLGGSEDFMCHCMTDEDLVSDFLEKITEFLTNYIKEYKNAGASGVIIAEPSSAMISPSMMEEFSNCYIQKIIKEVADESFLVIYHNCGNVNAHLDTICKLDVDAFHFGSDVDIEKAISSTDKIVMGNIEPQLFLGENGEEIKKQKDALSKLDNFIVSTGCDLAPDVPFAFFS